MGGRSARGKGARPPTLGTRPPLVANHGESHGLCSTTFKDRGKPFNQGRFDPMAQIHLKRLYKQGPMAPRGENPIIHYHIFQRGFRERGSLGFPLLTLTNTT